MWTKFDPEGLMSAVDIGEMFVSNLGHDLEFNFDGVGTVSTKLFREA